MGEVECARPPKQIEVDDSSENNLLASASLDLSHDWSPIIERGPTDVYGAYKKVSD